MAGAPKGNRNALKHGFYAKHCTDEEKKELNKKANRDAVIWAEIKLLRVVASRIFRDFEARDRDYSDADNTGTLMTLINCATRVSTLYRTDFLVAGDDNQAFTAIMEAIKDIEEAELGHII